MSKLYFSWKFHIPLNFCLKDVERLVHKTTETTFHLLLKHSEITFWDLFAHCWHHTNKMRCSLLHRMRLLSLIWHPLVRECVRVCIEVDLLSLAVLIQHVRAKPELTSVCQPLGSGEEECEWWLMASLQKLLSGAQKRPERQIAACTHRCLSLERTDRQACREKALSLLLATPPSYTYTSHKHTHTHHTQRLNHVNSQLSGHTLRLQTLFVVYSHKYMLCLENIVHSPEVYFLAHAHAVIKVSTLFQMFLKPSEYCSFFTTVANVIFASLKKKTKHCYVSKMFCRIKVEKEIS